MRTLVGRRLTGLMRAVAQTDGRPARLSLLCGRPSRSARHMPHNHTRIASIRSVSPCPIRSPSSRPKCRRVASVAVGWRSLSSSCQPRRPHHCDWPTRRPVVEHSREGRGAATARQSILQSAQQEDAYACTDSARIDHCWSKQFGPFANPASQKRGQTKRKSDNKEKTHTSPSGCRCLTCARKPARHRRCQTAAALRSGIQGSRTNGGPRGSLQRKKSKKMCVLA